LALFLDTNIPLYAAGRPHPLQDPCRRIIVLAAEHPLAFVSDAEVMQEMLHRFLALRLWPQGRAVIEEFATTMQNRVEPVGADDVLTAAAFAATHPRLTARDLIHLAVARRVGAQGIVTADQDFDAVAGLRRFDPALLETWLDEIVQ
jgi:predicted nucleic acid-binding protein